MGLRTNALMLLDDTIKTIATGAITITQTYHAVAAESGTADDLATINIDASLATTDGANTFRPFVILRADTGDTITVKHGTGNISLNGAADFELSGNKQLLLLFDGTNWTDLGAGGGSSSSTPNFGSAAIKTIASGVVTTGTDRNLVIAAESGTADDLIEITGLSVGDKVLLRADAGDTITVKHNDAGATVKILIQDDADFVLDEVHPLELVLVTTNQLAQVYDEVGAGGSNDISADTLVLNDGSELTIATGAITVTHARHSVDTEADAASDDLATVNGLAANETCIITANNTTRTVIVKNGTGNITSVTGADITLDDDVKAVCLLGNLAGTGVNAYPLFDEVTPSSTTTFTNKNISASANTISMGSGVTKTIASGVAAAGTDRNLIIAAESGTADDLIEVTGLSVGESVLLRADAGDTITVKHNDAGATVKIHLYGNADVTLDEQNPLRLTLVASNVLVQDIDATGSGGATVVSANKVYKFASNQSTTSNTMVDVDATNAAITATLTGSGKCLVTFNFACFKAGSGSAFFQITDGTNSSAEVEVVFVTGVYFFPTLTHVFNTSAGSTTYKLQYRSNNANAATLVNVMSVSMSLMEVA